MPIRFLFGSLSLCVGLIFASTVSAAQTKQTSADVQFNKVCLQIVKEVQRGAKKIPDKLSISPKNVKSGFQASYRNALAIITQKQENARRSKQKLNFLNKGKLTEQGVKELCKIVIAALLEPPPPPPGGGGAGGGGGGGAGGGGAGGGSNPGKNFLLGKVEKILAEQLHKNFEDSPHRYALRVVGDADFKDVLSARNEARVQLSSNCGYFVDKSWKKITPAYVQKDGELVDVADNPLEWNYNTPGECEDARLMIRILDARTNAVLGEMKNIEITWL